MSKRRKLVIALLLLATLGAASLLIPPNTYVHARDEALDTTAGRLRIREYRFGWKVDESVQDTALSQIYRAQIGPPPPPHWVDIDRQGQWRISFRGHSGFSPQRYAALRSGLRLMELALGRGEFTADGSRTAVARFLELADGQRPDAAMDFAMVLHGRACIEGPPITSEELRLVDPHPRPRRRLTTSAPAD